jgi:hypothetical protein
MASVLGTSGSAGAREKRCVVNGESDETAAPDSEVAKRGRYLSRAISSISRCSNAVVACRRYVLEP